MQVGFCSIAALDRPLEDAARAAAEAGADGLEVTERPPHLARDSGARAAEEAGRRVRQAGIEVIAFGSYFGKDQAVQPGDASEVVERAAAMGAPILRVWAEPAAATSRAELVDRLAEVSDRAAARGIQVVVERHLGSYADTPERIEALLAAVGCENFSLNYQVLDLLPSAALPTLPADATRLAGRARYLHLKNYRAREEDGLLLPGGDLAGGAVDHAALLQAVVRSGYDGPMTIEFLSDSCEPLEAKLTRDVRYLRDQMAALGVG